MKRPPVEPISSEVERLLAAERNIPPVSAKLRARVAERARAAFYATGSASLRRRSSSRPAWLLAAATVAAFAAVAFAAFQERRSNPVVATPPAGEPKVPRRAASVDPPAAMLAPAPEQPAIGAGAATAQKSEPEVTPRRSTSGTQALELEILQRARAAVASGQFSSALQAIAEHQRRFPAGVLQEEREALRVEALAGLGNTDDSRAAARRFRERFPDSVLSPRLDEATRKAP